MRLVVSAMIVPLATRPCGPSCSWTAGALRAPPGVEASPPAGAVTGEDARRRVKVRRTA
ncbi:hypothetical protein HMPREF0321_2765 [Dermacoccus sp. Ellin185]|nr:hypothetical protein HMPREF0321_2765 [Dermacoccus sp. Ellin185]